MPSEHKAFAFDYDLFAQELMPLLVNALESRTTSGLAQFIDLNLGRLRYPNDGATLGPDWRTTAEYHTPDEYGDFALTKYYQDNNIGIGYEWEEVRDIIMAARPDLKVLPILGDAIGPVHSPFNPGKLGSYFQTYEQAVANLSLARTLAEEWGSDLLGSTVGMLDAAVQHRLGLYVTF